MDDVKGDFRLYTYGGYGNLEKVGSLKSDSKGIGGKHFFNSLKEIKERVALLRSLTHKFDLCQFVIVQYGAATSSTSIGSKIVEIDNPINKTTNN